MSKADTLLKKATFFERLALYGDRKSYLQSIAQQQEPIMETEVGKLKAPMRPYSDPSWEEARSREFGNVRTIPAPPPLESLPKPDEPGTGTGTRVDQPAKPAMPSINPEDQKAVFQFAITQGELVPDPQKQIADGRLGNETRKALEGVKNYFAKHYPSYDPKKGGQRMTDQQAIQAAKFKGR